MLRILLMGLVLFSSIDCQARNTRYFLSNEGILDKPVAQNNLPDKDVQIYYTGQDTPKVVSSFKVITSHRKTNSVGKTDRTACEWAYLSAIKALQAKAKQIGANAVIDVKSDYKDNELDTADKYECHAGATVAGVVLKGTPVVLEVAKNEAESNNKK